MITDRQVVLTRQELMEGKSQQAAAVASGMSERSVRNWRKGPLPSEKKSRRRQRTRLDPFAGVWTEDIEPLLRSDVKGVLSAPTVLEWLDGRHPGRFGRSHLRTLQRRVQQWCRVMARELVYASGEQSEMIGADQRKIRPVGVN